MRRKVPMKWTIWRMPTTRGWTPLSEQQTTTILTSSYSTKLGAYMKCTSTLLLVTPIRIRISDNIVSPATIHRVHEDRLLVRCKDMRKIEQHLERTHTERINIPSVFARSVMIFGEAPPEEQSSSHLS